MLKKLLSLLTRIVNGTNTPLAHTLSNHLFYYPTPSHLSYNCYFGILQFLLLRQRGFHVYMHSAGNRLFSSVLTTPPTNRQVYRRHSPTSGDSDIAKQLIYLYAGTTVLLLFVIIPAQLVLYSWGSVKVSFHVLNFLFSWEMVINVLRFLAFVFAVACLWTLADMNHPWLSLFLLISLAGYTFLFIKGHSAFNIMRAISNFHLFSDEKLFSPIIYESDFVTVALTRCDDVIKLAAENDFRSYILRSYGRHLDVVMTQYFGVERIMELVGNMDIEQANTIITDRTVYLGSHHDEVLRVQAEMAKVHEAAARAEASQIVQSERERRSKERAANMEWYSRARTTYHFPQPKKPSK